MAIAENSMKPLFAKLQTTGIDAPFVKSLLPDWWDDSIASTPSGLQQATLLIARLLAIRPESLWTDKGAPVFALPDNRKFKHRADLDADSLDVACALAFSCGRIVSSGMDHIPVTKPTASAVELRSSILVTAKWVGLRELLAYCYSIGIPVIFLASLPEKSKKMDGLAFDCEGRPVIVLTKRHSYGYLLFALAHELGHIALGHLAPGGCILDKKIDGKGGDPDEQAADRFAIELLTGDPNKKIKSSASLTGVALAHEALKYGLANQIDPTHVAMNYGYTANRFGVASKAVTLISKGTPTDQELIRDMARSHLDLNAVKEDDVVALAQMTGGV